MPRRAGGVGGGGCIACNCNKSVADLSGNNLGPVMHVRCRETQDAEAGVDEQVLTTVVLDESFTVIGSVVLDDEPRGRVKEVGPADESTFGIAKLGLNFGFRQARLQ